MKISWAGQACFHISTAPAKDVQADIVIDPYGDIGFKLPSLSADIVLVSHSHDDHNNVKAVKPAGEGEPFVVQGPGEYEIKGVFVRGIDSWHDDAQGKERGKNTIYTIEAEDMRLCHLGDLGQKELTSNQLDAIGTVDILMIPAGGVYTIEPAEAVKIISQVEPKIVIPMHYALPKLSIKLEGVEKFLKAMGKNAVEPIDKLNIKASALPKEKQTEVVILKP